jgi:OOP family OmpA-OmpF porin
VIAAAEADLMANGRSTAVIAGYTDSNGSGADNERLSRQRAKSVRDLFAHNLQKSAGPVGRGETEPVGDNANEAGRRRNRRVVIKVRKPKP